MRNTVPLGSVVATCRVPPASAPPLSAGNEPVDQITQLSWFGRRDMTFLQISSTAMTARPLLSCPVTTRLIFSDILFSPECDPVLANAHPCVVALSASR